MSEPDPNIPLAQLVREKYCGKITDTDLQDELDELDKYICKVAEFYYDGLDGTVSSAMFWGLSEILKSVANDGYKGDFSEYDEDTSNPDDFISAHGSWDIFRIEVLTLGLDYMKEQITNATR